ncbi:MAG: Trk family potassium uptake protein [Kiritimatiellales bacterium]|nr:Trk family potassium uptake protein [Kiritimatiellota bacterium]MBL7012023.1 Trk family potassium uptake protein [Kiritimatiellales bacterium]
MLKRLTQRLNYIVGPVAIFAFVLLLLEHSEWLRPHPVLIRQINLSILGLFAVDVLLNWLAGSKDRAYLRRHWFDLIVFVPLIQFFYAPPDSALSVILRQTAIMAMLLSRTRRVKNFVTMFSLQPAQLMLMSFAGVIVFGTVLLMMPASTVAGEKTTLLNAFFTATSATCVTGLIVYDTATHFTFFGQLVILMLIQVGGLGIMTFSVSLALLMRRGVSMKDQSIMQDVLDQDTLQSVKRLVGFIVCMTFLLEAIGAVILFRAWKPVFHGSLETAWHAVFHSISAFCNAGFSTFSNSLMGFSTDVPTNLVIGGLIVLGGIGFVVIGDFYQALRDRLVRRIKRRYKFRIQSRLALGWTGGLILLGTGLVYWVERSRLLSDMAWNHALLASVFQSVTTRTAGFNTCEIGMLQPVTLFLFIILMFIGACPGGTGGGIKTTTPAVLWAVIRSGFNRRAQTELYRRSIPIEVVQKAIMVLCASLLLVCGALGLMLVFEPEKDFIDLFFETVSAFGTVGLSTGITNALSTGGRVIITLLMFVGRLGPLTIGFAFMLRKSQTAKYRYSEERIMIG